MAKDALNHFANVLLQEASEQKKQTIEKLEAKRSEQIKQAEHMLKQQFDQKIEAGLADVKQQLQLSLTRREVELHKMLLKNRQKAFEAVFSAVTENVRRFTKTPEYKDFFQKEFAQISSYFEEKTGENICTVMEQDQELAKQLIKLPNLTIQLSPQDFIGGFTLENSQLHYFADCTLKNRIEKQKEIFYQTSGLIID